MSVKKYTEQLEQLEFLKQEINDSIARIEQKLIKANGNLKFKFPDGVSVPYRELLLIKSYYTERGLGYEDDKEHFSEYKIAHPNRPYFVRFLSDESIKKYGIPHKIYDHYGTSKIRQSEYGEIARHFEQKFFSVVREGVSSMGHRNFWNL